MRSSDLLGSVVIDARGVDLGHVHDLTLVQDGPPKDDPAALVVRHEQDGLVFGTVFGELIDARPGLVRLEYSRQPWSGEPWRALEVG